MPKACMLSYPAARWRALMTTIWQRPQTLMRRRRRNRYEHTHHDPGLWNTRFTAPLSHYSDHDTDQSSFDASELSQGCASGSASADGAREATDALGGSPFLARAPGLPDRRRARRQSLQPGLSAHLLERIWGDVSVECGGLADPRLAHLLYADAEVRVPS